MTATAHACARLAASPANASATPQLLPPPLPSVHTQTLFPPLLAVDITSTRVEGSALVATARFSLNMTSLTLEQHEGRRKTLVTNMCDQVIPTMRYDFSNRIESMALIPKGLSPNSLPASNNKSNILF